MKKLLVILLLAILSSGCSVYWGIGMSQEEFLNRNRGLGIESVEANGNRTVYRFCNNYECWFYYFSNGTMYAMDKGEAAPDIIIQSK